MEKTLLETERHIKLVQAMLMDVVIQLIERSRIHDQSKLESPEAETFDVYTHKLAECTYGSEEYKQFLKEMKPALDHHYAKNRHHPEHWNNGVDDMDLIDLVEMLVDWKAASARHHDGNILTSIDKNSKRFKLSEQLATILRNTATRLWG